MRFAVAVFIFVLAGCSHKQQYAPPTAAEIRRDEIVRANKEQVVGLLKSGQIRAGQSLQELLAVCRPYQILFVEKYAFVVFEDTSAMGNVLIMAVDDQLMHASEFSCTFNNVYFNTFSKTEEELADDAYSERIHR